MSLTVTTAAPGALPRQSGTARRPVTAGLRRRVAICNWRDLRHPEGGGSELYVESTARGLVAAGHDVTLLCARVDGQPADEVRDGVTYRRRGGRFTVYLHAAYAIATRRVPADVVMDVQNGVPFLSPLVTRRPVVALVHHVHREQWPILFGRRAATVGWWVESRLGPWLYRRSRYLVVSEATRQELAALGVDPSRVTVAHNGSPQLPTPRLPRSTAPRVVVLGRLVPHKRVEIVLRAAAAIRGDLPGLHVDVVGQGWHETALRALVAELGIDDVVTFHGFVDDQVKSDLLAAAWVNAVPSVKEGWALSVVEAARHGTPSLAFDDAGGLSESIVDGATGVLVRGDQDAFAAQLRALLADHGRRNRLGAQARRHADTYTWDATVRRVTSVLEGTAPDSGR